MPLRRGQLHVCLWLRPLTLRSDSYVDAHTRPDFLSSLSALNVWHQQKFPRVLKDSRASNNVDSESQALGRRGASRWGGRHRAWGQSRPGWWAGRGFRRGPRTREEPETAGLGVSMGGGAGSIRAAAAPARNRRAGPSSLCTGGRAPGDSRARLLSGWCRCRCRRGEDVGAGQQRGPQQGRPWEAGLRGQVRGCPASNSSRGRPSPP